MSKVTVKIHGQEYTITGDRSEAQIKEIASHVDEQMRQIANFSPDTTTGSLAVLSAVNIAEEYMDMKARVGELTEKNSKLEDDAAYYMAMWEKVKKNSQANRDSENQLKERIKALETDIGDLRKKLSEYESSFFDLQMENVQQKNELAKLKGNER